MFQVGEKIYYPMHGVGIVESIEEQQVLGKMAKYYTLRFIDSKMSAMVPTETAVNIGLRALISEELAMQIISYLGEDNNDETDNWNKRYRENLDKLKGGDIFAVADVVKCLVKRDKDRGLSAGERKMYLSARSMLLSELTLVSGREEDSFFELVGSV